VEIKESIYTLQSNSASKNVFLRRDGNVLYCPRSADNNVCGSWCPAFTFVKGSVNPYVYIECFPNQLSFKIQEAPNDQV
jgi:hypothetical protein